MTMPAERTRAVNEARKFLQELTNPQMTPGIPEKIRYAASALLRHYPDCEHMRFAAHACPQWFGNPDSL